MSEQSLYRRHRPQSFADVVGQEHVVRTLSNAIERDRVHHAYLFVGSRGTGKTSMAKILARSLNCVNGPTLTPCDACDSCQTIAAGTSMDVIEMDAASNRSVDDIRELRERVGFAPAGGKWKVYILDEAHMLTREAWNAFLKTLEEPPPNTVFVLATTEAHKVMPTIVDRCQRFDFARPTPENIAEVIGRVAAAESITLEPSAVGTLARAANGSFRDALGTLDQLVAYSGSEVSTVDVTTVLGLADNEMLFAAADAIAAEDGRRVLELVTELAAAGRDPARFAVDLVTHLRQLLVVATVGEVPQHFYLAADDERRLGEQATTLGEVALVRAIDQLSAAISAVREGDEARMTVELAMLKAARPEIDPSRTALAQRLERLERAIEGGEAPPAGPPAGGSVGSARAAEGPTIPAAAPPESTSSGPTPAESASSGPAATESTSSEPAPAAESTAGEDGALNPVEALAQGAAATAEQARSRVDEVRSEVEKGVDEVRSEVEAKAEEVRSRVERRVEAVGEVLDLERLVSLWPAVVDQVKESGAEFLSTAFAESRPVAVDSGAATVEVGFPPSAAFNKRKAEASENRERFSDALRAIVGRRLSPSYVLLDSEPEPEESEAPVVDAPADEQAIMDVIKAEFDAEEMLDDPEEDAS